MNHVKELELKLLSRLIEVDKIENAEFIKNFPNNAQEFRSVLDGLYIGTFVLLDYVVDKKYFRITDKGRVRFSELKKEKDEEVAAKHESKEVSAWTIVAGIGGGIAAIPVIIEFIKWIISLFHK